MNLRVQFTARYDGQVVGKVLNVFKVKSEVVDLKVELVNLARAIGWNFWLSILQFVCSFIFAVELSDKVTTFQELAVEVQGLVWLGEGVEESGSNLESCAISICYKLFKLCNPGLVFETTTFIEGTLNIVSEAKCVTGVLI